MFRRTFGAVYHPVAVLLRVYSYWTASTMLLRAAERAGREAVDRACKLSGTETGREKSFIGVTCQGSLGCIVRLATSVAERKQQHALLGRNQAVSGAARGGARLGDPETLYIQLLGRFQVRVGSRVIEDDGWPLRKAAVLVKLLALTPGHHLHRERIMDLLWPDLASRAAANNLRYVLHNARRTLEPDTGTPSHYLHLRDEQLTLSSAGRLWVDVEAFEDAAATARRARVPAAYRVALDLYEGDLLPGDRYEEWAEGRRAELRALYLTLLSELVELHEEREEHGPAAEVLGRVVVEEPAHEEAHVSLMRLYAASGRRGEALRQYERLREVLRRELATEPDAASQRLHEEISAGRFLQARSPPTRPAPEESPSVRLHNLPAARTSFVGRERELAEVKRMLAMNTLLTLTGTGGSGKTRLALETARDLVGAYADGVWLVELAPISEPMLVPQALAGALQVREQPNRPLTETLVDVLRKKKMLLLLDNCEHLVDAAAHLVDTLLTHCSGLRILATSREPLGVGGEINWPVPSLSSPDPEHDPTVEELEGYESARLFVERALYRPSAFVLTPENARAVAEICKRLDGMPLAIELAAARVGALAVEQISERLGDSLRLLTGGNRTTTPRQQTLRGALDWSYRLLTEPEKKLLCRLSVFAGGWTLEAAEVVGAGEGVAEDEVLDLVSRLVDKSLLVAGAGGNGALRYRFLEPVRQYAREKLEDRGEADAVSRRHATFFLALGEELAARLSGPEMAGALDELTTELLNLRVALAWTLERDEAEKAVRLAGALYSFWNFRGYLDEGRRWLDMALAKSETAQMTRVDALLAAAGLAALQGDHPRANAFAEEGLTLSRTHTYPFGIVRALFLLGVTAEWQGDIDRAAMLYEETLERRRDFGAPHWVARSLAALAAVTRLRGDAARAEALAEEALALARKTGHAWTVAMSLGVLANVATGRGDDGLAVRLYEESLALSLELGDHWGAGGTVAGLAGIVVARDRPERAARLLGAARGLGDAIGVARLAQHEEYERVLAATRARLDEGAFAAAWEAGRRLSPEQAIAEALDEASRITPQPVERRDYGTYLAAAHARLGGTGREVSSEEKRQLMPEGAAGYPLAATGSSVSASEVSLTDGRSDALTPREQEVAVLLARGLSDRRIAGELTISERTVTTHVGKILKKLGFQSRTQVATWAVEQRLLPPGRS
jgi:predicted ATPase/DNA-binding SARP family transcriptional activator/DNA-binding CsgD family transcriptional regulator